MIQGIPLKGLFGGLPYFNDLVSDQHGAEFVCDLFDWKSETRWDPADGEPSISRIRAANLRHYPFWKVCALQHSTFTSMSISDLFRRDNLLHVARSERTLYPHSSYPNREEKLISDMALTEQDLWNYRVWSKIGNASWRWGVHTMGWNQISRHFNHMGQFSFGDGFEVTLDHTRGCNEIGLAYYQMQNDDQVFIDAPFCYCVYLNGERVATIGFVPHVNDRILLTQFQMAKPKGNRWLYKLRKPLLDHVVERMEAAFPYATICIPTPASFIKYSNSTHDPSYQDLSEEVKIRILRNYGSGISGHRRGSRFRISVGSISHMIFQPLIKLQSEVLA